MIPPKDCVSRSKAADAQDLPIKWKSMRHVLMTRYLSETGQKFSSTRKVFYISTAPSLITLRTWFTPDLNPKTPTQNARAVAANHLMFRKNLLAQRGDFYFPSYACLRVAILFFSSFICLRCLAVLFQWYRIILREKIENGPIVKWYNGAFALHRREFDSPWVHHKYKFIWQNLTIRILTLRSEIKD